MKIRFSPLVSDIIISVYVVLTLAFRFYYDQVANDSWGTSLVIGLAFLVILWVLIKAKILQPNWFGLFKKK